MCNEPVLYFPQALQIRMVGLESTAQGKWQTIWFRKTRKYKMYGGNHCLYYFQRQNRVDRYLFKTADLVNK